MLLQACPAQDRLASLSARICKDGAVVMGRYGPKPHPLLKQELQTRAFIIRTVCRLAVNEEPKQPVVRPAKGFGWQP